MMGVRGGGAVLSSPEPPGVAAIRAACSSAPPSSQPNPPLALGCRGPGVYLQIATLLLPWSLSFGLVAGVGEGSGLCAVRKGPCPSSQQTPRAVLGETRREEVFPATEGPRGLMPARALGCESQEPRPVGVSGAVGTLSACGSSALMLPPRPWPPPGFEKDDSRKGDRARERNRGRWSRGITVRLETPLVRGGAGLQAQGYLSMDNFAKSESRRPASPASPPLACPRGRAAFGAPAARFPGVGRRGQGAGTSW